MKPLLLLTATALCLTIIGCSSDSGGKSATEGGTTSGRGTINVSGELNTVTTFGTNNKGTRVGCLRNPGINYSDINLMVDGQSKYRVDASESLSISFHSADYPMGYVNFPMSNQISYAIGEESYSNVGGSKDCYANLSPVGSTSLSGTITCKGMVGQRGGKIDIQAAFECSVQTLN